MKAETVLRLFVLFSCLAITIAPAELGAQGGQVRFLVLTDLHFDPLASASLAKLLDTPVSGWRSLLTTSELSPGGDDSNYALLKSALDDAKRRVPDPAFILVAGDFLEHNWSSTTSDSAKLKKLTRMTLEFLAEEFKSRWPTTAVLPALGNNDTIHSHYETVPGGFLQTTFTEVWKDLLRAPGSTIFQDDFPKGGYYSRDLPGFNDRRLIAINSTFFSVSRDSPLRPDPSVHDWLEGQLEQAQKDGKKVWLLMHIAPGIDSYGAAHGSSGATSGQCPTTTKPSSWCDADRTDILGLYEKFSPVIEMTFAGHAHMDDYRIIPNGGDGTVLKLAPSISPVFGNNPAYGVYVFTVPTEDLDYETFYLPCVGTSGGSAVPSPLPASTPWQQEYRFSKCYDVGRLDAQTAGSLVSCLFTPGAADREQYEEFYYSSAFSLGDSTITPYACAITSETPAELQNCVKTSHPASKTCSQTAGGSCSTFLPLCGRS